MIRTQVRDYVKKTIGSKFLIPLLGVWNKYEEIDFKKLPKKFVLKATHGSGSNHVVYDRNKINYDILKQKINKWLVKNYYAQLVESQYKNIKPRIICEKYLEDSTGGLTDYKIFCYNGKPKFIDVHTNRFVNHRTFYMDLKWKKLSIHVEIEPKTKTVKLQKPKNLSEMIAVAKKLSRGFPFVRVDLYSVNGKTYFGELTFIPAGGLLKYSENTSEILLGRDINLNLYK